MNDETIPVPDELHILADDDGRYLELLKNLVRAGRDARIPELATTWRPLPQVASLAALEEMLRDKPLLTYQLAQITAARQERP